MWLSAPKNIRWASDSYGCRSIPSPPSAKKMVTSIVGTCSQSKCPVFGWVYCVICACLFGLIFQCAAMPVLFCRYLYAANNPSESILAKRHQTAGLGFVSSKIILLLGGGFKSCLFSPLPGEMIQFDSYFSNGWFNHHLVCITKHATIWSVCPGWNSDWESFREVQNNPDVFDPFTHGVSKLFSICLLTIKIKKLQQTCGIKKWQNISWLLEFLSQVFTSWSHRELFSRQNAPVSLYSEHPGKICHRFSAVPATKKIGSANILRWQCGCNWWISWSGMTFLVSSSSLMLNEQLLIQVLSPPTTWQACILDLTPDLLLFSCKLKSFWIWSGLLIFVSSLDVRTFWSSCSTFSLVFLFCSPARW